MNKNMYQALSVFVSSIAFFVLLAPVDYYSLAMFLVLGIISGLILIKERPTLESYNSNKFVFLIGCLSTFVICSKSCIAFIENWVDISIISGVASIFGVSNVFVSTIIGVILAIFASKSVLLLFIKTIEVFNTWVVIPFILVLYGQLQFSANPIVTQLFSCNWLILLLNCLCILLYIILWHWLLKENRLVFLIVSVTTTIWSLCNYYIIAFHGSPLFFSELMSFNTAVNVISAYKLFLDRNVVIILLFFIGEIVISFFMFHLVSNLKKDELSPFSLQKKIIYVLLFCTILVVLLKNESIKPKQTMTWSWEPGVYSYGYISCIFEDINKRINPIENPISYDKEGLIQYIDSHDSESKMEAIQENTDTDIILILNESFYDLSIYTDINTDNDYIEQFYNIKDAFYGHVCEPLVGGGTNNTEFELLTSNSMTLLPISAPFNYLNFARDKNSVALALKEQGYTCAAMHCAVPSNYSRDKVYPLLGFDEVILGRDYYVRNVYGNRPWLDSDNYSDLIDTYNNMDDQSPRFVYMLTYQNHGGYDQNEAVFDTVHVQNEFGDITDDINEYLTSIERSSTAIHNLIDYYRNVDRHVIICMLGDHAPSFINSLRSKDSQNEIEADINKHMVPILLWANYEIDYNIDDITLNKMSVPDIIPIIKFIAGIKLTNYDYLILSLHEVYPVRLTNGLIQKTNGDSFIYNGSGTDDNYKLLDYYYTAEYGIITGDKEICEIMLK